MDEQNTKQNAQENAAPNAPNNAEEAAGNRCTQCTCQGFQSDPNELNTCIAPRPPQGRCQHSYMYHPA